MGLEENGIRVTGLEKRGERMWVYIIFLFKKIIDVDDK